MFIMNMTINKKVDASVRFQTFCLLHTMDIKNSIFKFMMSH